jgi:mRNA-degrading endonuclease toxin of MazEF toxin-antitoxin module
MARSTVTPVRRGLVYFADLGPIVELAPGVRSREIALHRPVVVLSIDAINRVSDRQAFQVLVVPGTTGASQFKTFPTTAIIQPGECGLSAPTAFLALQLRSIDSRRLGPQPVGRMSDTALTRVEDAVRYSLFGR